MPDNKITEYNEHLVSLARELDISPSDYKKAKERYEAVGKYLDEGEYEGATNGVSVYPQGSFQLGTVTRPIKDSKEAGYDIDLVCELSIPITSIKPERLKHTIGNRLKENQTYNRMLGEEGKRCWKLEYAEENGVDFHMDVLPSVRKNQEKIDQLRESTDYTNLVDTAIAITNKKEGETYIWSSSNPKGYSEWFKLRNRSSYLLVEYRERLHIFESNKGIFAEVADVPDQLIRTPLQQSIQILKRHRDVYFAGHKIEKYKPISIIITTLAAHVYNNEDNVYDALKNIIANLRKYLPSVDQESQQLSEKLIQRVGDNWYIGNPVDAQENFADRWHEDNNARAKAFFQWISVVNTDLIDIVSNNDFDSILYSTALNLKVSNPNLSQKSPSIISKPAKDMNKPIKPYYKSERSCLKKL